MVDLDCFPEPFCIDFHYISQLSENSYSATSIMPNACFSRKPLRQRPRFQWFAFFYISLCHRLSNTSFFMSGAFDASKTLHFPCFLFFFLPDHGISSSLLDVPGLFATIPWAFRPFLLRFRTRANHSCFIPAPPRAILVQFCGRPSPSRHSAAIL